MIHLSLWKDYHLVFILNVSRFHRRICFGDCDVCYLYHRENLESSYKCSNVELICSECVKRKHFVSVKSTTWMVPGHLKGIQICLVLI